MFYLATRDVRQGAKLAKQGATQFRKNIKTMREWAEDGAEKCDPGSGRLHIITAFNSLHIARVSQLFR